MKRVDRGLAVGFAVDIEGWIRAHPDQMAAFMRHMTPQEMLAGRSLERFSLKSESPNLLGNSPKAALTVGLDGDGGVRRSEATCASLANFVRKILRVDWHRR